MSSLREFALEREREQLKDLELELLRAADTDIRGSSPAGWTVTARGRVGYDKLSIAGAIRKLAEKILADEVGHPVGGESSVA